MAAQSSRLLRRSLPLVLLAATAVSQARADTGKIRWVREIPGSDCPKLAASQGLVLASSEVRGRSPRESGLFLRAFDLATGRPRWKAQSRSDYEPLDKGPVVAGGRVFEVLKSSLSDFSDVSTAPSDLVNAYDLGTGERLWRLRMPLARRDLDLIDYAADRRRVYLVGVRYRPISVFLVLALDAATGRQVWSAAFAPPGGALAFLAEAEGDRLHVVGIHRRDRQARSRALIRTYEASTGRLDRSTVLFWPIIPDRLVGGVDSLLILGRTAANGRGRIVAHSTRDGSVWQRLSSRFLPRGIASTGTAHIAFGPRGDDSSGRSELRAYGATSGKRLWRRSFPGEDAGTVAAGRTRIFTSAGFGELAPRRRTVLRSFRVLDGADLWSQPLVLDEELVCHTLVEKGTLLTAGADVGSRAVLRAIAP